MTSAAGRKEGSAVGTSRSRRNGRKSLELSDLIAAAQHVIESEGIDALTMRKLSTELDVGVMTLYGHIRTKEGLINLVAAQHFAELTIPEVEHDDVATVLRATYSSLRDLYINPPYLASIHTSQAAPPPAAYVFIERILALFASVGVDDALGATMHLALLNYTLGSALFSLPRGPGAGPSAELVAALGAVSSNEFPSVSATVLVLAQAATREQFEFGLDLLIAGFEATHGPLVLPSQR
jgi:AcrR family transcriptional regulator